MHPIPALEPVGPVPLTALEELADDLECLNHLLDLVMRSQMEGQLALRLAAYLTDQIDGASEELASLLQGEI